MTLNCFPSGSKEETVTPSYGKRDAWCFCCLRSTNGTVINKLKLVKKQTCPLEPGDVIYVVYRRNEPEHSESGGFLGGHPHAAAAAEGSRGR